MAAKGGEPEETIVRIVPLRFSATTVAPGAEFTVTTFVSGGKGPYKYGIGFDKDEIKAETPVDPSGWIIKSLSAPKTTAERSTVVRVVVEDTDKHSAEVSAPLGITP